MNRTAAWFLGGLLAGSAVLTAVLGGFGAPEGGTSLHFPGMGFDGIDNIQIFNQGIIAIVMLVCGVSLMAWASSGAWKETGGY